MEKMNEEKIDFVMLWVDGSDPKWLEEKAQYSNNANSKFNTVNRYRDWDLLKYWFRGAEKYASWVNHIYFITCGHYPKWLNLNHPKLKFVKHEDYIPKEYLPTFSSHPIELNLHRIEELSEKFVYFNDDVFILKQLLQEDFFKNDKPRYIACTDIIHSENYEDMFPHILLNNESIINKYYNKKQVMKKNWSKWFSLKYGTKLLMKNFSMLSYNRFSDLYEPHVGIPLLKSTMEELWEKEKEILNRTSQNKFRGKEDINQYLFKWYDIGRGNFEPSPIIGKYLNILSEKDDLLRTVENQKCKMVCFGDDETINFEETKQELTKAFEKVFPEKSSFEL